MTPYSIVKALKLKMKAHDITYRDLSEKLNITEQAVKQMFAKSDFSLTRLCQICDAIGVEVRNLLHELPTSDALPSSFSRSQEDALALDSEILLTLYLLMMGSDMMAIANKTKWGLRKLRRLVSTLDKLGLIEAHPNDRIRLRVISSPRWDPNGPLALKYSSSIKEQFFCSNFSGPMEYQDFLTATISLTSFSKLKQKVKLLFREFEELSRADKSDETAELDTFWFYSGIRPWDILGVIERERHSSR